MNKDKNYNGYKSFQYLEPGSGYTEFELADELDRVPSYEIPLSQEEEDRAYSLLENNTVVSLHDHPTLLPKNMDEIISYKREGRAFTAYQALSQSGLDVVFDNLMDGTNLITSKNGWKWRDTVYDLGMRLADIAHQDLLKVARGVGDLVTAREQGKIAWVPTLEASTMIENEVDRIDVLYGLGIRMMGIAYCQANSLGSGQEEDRDGGLTSLGHRAVERMNKLGIAIDISHSGPRTSLDVIEASQDPVFLTHGGARALTEEGMPNYRRMAPDEVLKGVASSGGVIGIEAAPHQTITVNQREHTIDSAMEHFEYCADLVGLDHVGFGPDTMFGDHVGVHHAFSDQLSIEADPSSYTEVEYVKGLENPAENFPNIVKWLVKHGYSDEEIRTVIGSNIIEALKQVWDE